MSENYTKVVLLMLSIVVVTINASVVKNSYPKYIGRTVTHVEVPKIPSLNFPKVNASLKFHGDPVNSEEIDAQLVHDKGLIKPKYENEGKTRFKVVYGRKPPFKHTFYNDSKKVTSNLRAGAKIAFRSRNDKAEEGLRDILLRADLVLKKLLEILPIM